MKHLNLISQMSLEDKIMLCEGADFWHTKAFEKYKIPPIMMCDGPHGLRKQETAGDQLGINISKPATCFPAACATGSSWDRELLKRIGNAIAEEAIEEEISIVLGPGINIKRNPLCGRNFEYFSEDPYVSGELGASFIQGIEEKGIATSLKHFAANSQESKRFTSDSIVDERTLREIYLAGFEIAVKKGKPQTIMCAYNKLNQIYCSSNKYLLSDILRDEWGFEGVVVTDWGAMYDKTEGFKATCDLEMPGGHYYFKDEVMKAVREGRLSEVSIDQSVDRILTLVFKAAERKKDQSVFNAGVNTGFNREEHHLLARKAAVSSAVLLKNEDGILPLKKQQKIAVIGPFAKKIRFQGSGSSYINPIKLVNPSDAFNDNNVSYSYYEGCGQDGSFDGKLADKAARGAAEADVAVVFAGLTDRFESEGFDRETMDMPEGHKELIEEIAKANSQTVVVLMAGSPITMPWIDSVKAVLHMHLPGEAGGEAAFDLLFGHENPSGKLSESYPIRYEDVPSSGFYEKGREVAEYREGIYVGYRYYDKAKKEVLFPFGFGLSYTSFQYAELEVQGGLEVQGIQGIQGIQGNIEGHKDQGEKKENKGITVTARITNTGKCSGAEVVQLYVSTLQSSVHHPEKELKGFGKVYLEAGESKKVSFSLDRRSFAFYNVEKKCWSAPAGEYNIALASSSRDIKLEQTVVLEGDKESTSFSNTARGTWYENLSGKPERKDLEAMIGRSIEDYKVPKRKNYTIDHSIVEMKDSFIMRQMYKFVERVNGKTYGEIDYANPTFRMAMICATEVPIKNLCMMSGGMLKKNVAHGLVHMANGRFLKGIKAFCFK